MIGGAPTIKITLNLQKVKKDLEFDDDKAKDSFDVSMISRGEKGASVYIGRLLKADIKKLAKAS